MASFSFVTLSHQDQVVGERESWGIEGVLGGGEKSMRG